MFNLPKPKLGDVTAITIATPDLEQSLTYYQKLGFKEVIRHDFPFPWIQVSDGALLIMLRMDKTPYISLTYYLSYTEMDRVVNELERTGITFIEKPKSTDMVKRYLIQSLDKVIVALVSNVDNIFRQPPGPTMLSMPQQDYSNPEKYVNKTCGMYGEFAHPVKNIEKSIAFWQQLGFITLSKFESPYPWAIISDGLSVVGLHQTTNFSYPAITFFASDMKNKISKLKNDGLKDYSGGESNITLTTPEQQHINLFQLGM